jgi:hypothetical protein
MKKIALVPFMLILLFVFLFTACSQPADEVVEPEPQQEEAVVEKDDTADETSPEAVMEDDDSAMQDEEVEMEDDEAAIQGGDEEMEALILEKIEDCHVLNFVLSKTKTREEWSDTLDRMIGYGAKINEEEKERIIEWLVSRNE